MNVSGASPNTEMTRIEIARGDLARIRNGRGVLLCVQCGAVWVTQSGSTDDVLLTAGASFRIDRHGLTLVSTCGRAPQALVTLAPPARVAPSLAKRFWSLLVGWPADTVAAFDSRSLNRARHEVVTPDFRRSASNA